MLNLDNGFNKDIIDNISDKFIDDNNKIENNLVDNNRFSIFKLLKKNILIIISLFFLL